MYNLRGNSYYRDKSLELPQLSAKAKLNPKLSGVKRLALVNNLLTLLGTQKKVDLSQEKTTAAKEELSQIQLKNTFSMKGYYKTIFSSDNI